MKAEPKTYTLKFPVETVDADGTVTATLNTLTMRRLKGKDMRAADGAKGPQSATLIYIAKSAGVPVAVVDLFDAEDIIGAGEIVAGFLGSKASPSNDGTLEDGSPGAA